MYTDFIQMAKLLWFCYYQGHSTANDKVNKAFISV